MNNWTKSRAERLQTHLRSPGGLMGKTLPKPGIADLSPIWGEYQSGVAKAGQANVVKAVSLNGTCLKWKRSSVDVA